MIKDKDIGFFKKLYLFHLSTKQEKALLNDDNDEYMRLTAKHFKTYFGLGIATVVVNFPDSLMSKSVLDRHACMVICNVFSDASPSTKEFIYRTSKKAFVKNLLLEEYL